MSARRRDNGKWEVRWRQGGRRYSRTFDRKRDAERFDVELRRRLQLGALGLFEQDVTLGEFVEEWWRTHVIPNLAVSTRVSYRHTWSKHVLPRLGGYRVAIGPSCSATASVSRPCVAPWRCSSRS
jgi:hypothetical protein